MTRETDNNENIGVGPKRGAKADRKGVGRGVTVGGSKVVRGCGGPGVASNVRGGGGRGVGCVQGRGGGRDYGGSRKGSGKCEEGRSLKKNTNKSEKNITN